MNETEKVADAWRTYAKFEAYAKFKAQLNSDNLKRPVRYIQYAPRIKFLRPRLSKFEWINSLFYRKSITDFHDTYLSV